MTVFMVTHDINEAFKLGTRLIVFDRPRLDPQAPGRFGATITYDLDLTRDSAVARARLREAARCPARREPSPEEPTP